MTDDGGVLGNLPNSRPGKRSAKRDSARSAQRKSAAGRPAKAAEKAATKAEASGKPAAKPPRSGTSAKPGLKGRRERVSEPEPPGDAVGAVVRTAAGLAVTGAKVAGAVTQELLRRLPRP
jgi:hypothetical protein